MMDDDIPLDPSTLIRLGVISEVTLSPPRCRVRFGDPEADDGEIVSPPVRWIAVRAGATRRWSPPTKNEECVLFCPDGQIGNGIALCGLYNENNPPPSDELLDLIRYADGAVISYDPEAHHLAATLPEGASATIKATTITLDAESVHATGTITADGDVVAGGISLKGHRHPNIQRGAALSDPPSA